MCHQQAFVRRQVYAQTVLSASGGKLGSALGLLLSLKNKVLVYKIAIKPIWTYGIELWGCASNSSIATLQRCQSKILRSMADAPRYVSNSTLHNDLGIQFIKDVLQERSTKHHDRLEVHLNTLLQPLLEMQNNRRLKRCLPIDLK